MGRPVDCDPRELERGLRLLHPSDIVEVRAIGVRRLGRTHKIVSGYFSDLVLAAAAAAKLSGHADGVYALLNSPNPALLARRVNRVAVAGSGETTADHDVLRRHWLLVDCDALRPAKISATDEEVADALRFADRVAQALLLRGWPDPVRADSGNGAHLLYRIDLPPDDGGLVQRVLEALAVEFDTATVKIDTSVYNPARITKLYGTLARKGDETPDRPWRYSRIVCQPDHIAIVPEALLRQEAKARSSSNGTNGTSSSKNGTRTNGFDLGHWVERHLPEATGPEPWKGGGLRWVIPVCPWNPDHDQGEAHVEQQPHGPISAGCRHHSCVWTWRDLRGRFEPGCYDNPAEDPWPKTPCSDSTQAAGQVRSELENAQRFVAQHGKNLRHIQVWHRWLVWDGTRWAHDDTGEVQRRAKATARERTIIALDSADKDALKFARTSESARGLEAALALAATERGIAIRHETLDHDGWVLNVANGTIELRTGTLRPHNRDDLCTKLAPVHYDITATSPLWQTFLDEILPDPEVRAFLQRLIGYCLTADVEAQSLVFFWGLGANGKSTLISVLQHVLGDYAVQAPGDLLLKKRGESHPTELTVLFGKRLAVCSEVEEGRALSEVLVKQLTGNDAIAARRMRENFWSFQPTHKLIVTANHRPTVRGTDHAIWRRIKLVPFTVTIDKDRRDPNLAAKLLQEAPGILAWAVAGCLAWQNTGLAEPATVRAATAAYRSSMDLVAKFIDERCVVSPHAQATSAGLYAAYQEWAQAAGEKVMAQRGFSERLAEQGFEPDRVSKHRTRIWRGIGLAQVGEDS